MKKLSWHPKNIMLWALFGLLAVNSSIWTDLVGAAGKITLNSEGGIHEEDCTRQGTDLETKYICTWTKNGKTFKSTAEVTQDSAPRRGNVNLNNLSSNSDTNSDPAWYVETKVINDDSNTECTTCSYSYSSLSLKDDALAAIKEVRDRLHENFLEDYEQKKEISKRRDACEVNSRGKELSEIGQIECHAKKIAKQGFVKRLKDEGSDVTSYFRDHIYQPLLSKIKSGSVSSSDVTRIVKKADKKLHSDEGVREMMADLVKHDYFLKNMKDINGLTNSYLYSYDPNQLWTQCAFSPMGSTNRVQPFGYPGYGAGYGSGYGTNYGYDHGYGMSGFPGNNYGGPMYGAGNNYYGAGPSFGNNPPYGYGFNPYGSSMNFPYPGGTSFDQFAMNDFAPGFGMGSSYSDVTVNLNARNPDCISFWNLGFEMDRDFQKLFQDYSFARYDDAGRSLTRAQQFLNQNLKTSMANPYVGIQDQAYFLPKAREKALAAQSHPFYNGSTSTYPTVNGTNSPTTTTNNPGAYTQALHGVTTNGRPGTRGQQRGSAPQVNIPQGVPQVSGGRTGVTSGGQAYR